MDRVTLGRLAVWAYLGAVLAFPVLPLTLHAQPPLYSALGLVAVVAAWRAVLRLGAPARQWSVVVSGFTAWWLGDLVYGVMNGVDAPGTRPALSNVLFFSGYALVAVGVVRIAGKQRHSINGVWVLDAVMACVGLAVPLSVVLASSSAVVSAGLDARLILSGYVLGDLFVVGVLVRLLALTELRSSTWLLVAAMTSSLFADAAFQYYEVTGHPTLSRWVAEGWLAGYVLVALAARRTRSHPAPPVRNPPRAELRSLVVVAVVAMLPGLTLAIQGCRGGPIVWQPIAAGAVCLSLLMLARMSHLLRLLQRSSEAMSQLARLDALTGLPNRRTWDHELARASATGAPFVVAVLDIDHFKQYNDAFGHPAGDDVLRRAARAWRELLEPRHFLARYGGEEFALVLRDLDLRSAAAAVERLRAGTPAGQSFSGGLASWAPGLDIDAVFSRADAALLAAKAAGRDRVVIADGAPTDVG